MDPTWNILLCGDFNFSKEIVTWIASDEGIFAHPAPGNTDQKIAFNLLLDLTTELGMEQQVSRPTRKDNILDLVFTSSSVVISARPPIPIAPASDHNFVAFDCFLTDNDHTHREEEVENHSPNLSQFNYARGDIKRLSEEIESVDWEAFFSDSLPMDQCSESLFNKLM